MTINTRGLDAIIRGLDGAIDRGVDTTANQIHDAARQNVPVDTGALQTSIEVFGAEGSGERTVEAGQSLDYAQWVEYGSSRAPAQPFMTPALEQHRDDLPKNIAAEIGALIRRSGV